MSFRVWLSIATAILLIAILYLSRHELVRAWELMGQVNLWVLLLLIPGQILVYYANGEMIFSYLRGKGNIKDVSRGELIRVALEGNFVNHVLPSGGVSGVSYLSWRLKHLGVPVGRATMAQVVRYVVGFVAFAVLLLVALIAVTVDGELNRWIILASSSLFGSIIVTIVAVIFLLSSKRRTVIFGDWLYRTFNLVTRRVTFGRKRKLIGQDIIEGFLDDMHHDYVALRHEKELLKKPFIWGLIFTLTDAALFMITFWALGQFFNPAPILIAYGVAAMAGFFVLTPGGAGAYEAIMVALLAFAGIPGGVAIAGVLLTRVILLLGTIIFGYVFYQHALTKYGSKRRAAKAERQ